MSRPAHAPVLAITCLLIGLCAASLALAPRPASSPPASRVAHAAPRTTLGCTGAITVAGGATIIGGFAGDAVSTTVATGVRCDGGTIVRVRHLAGGWSCVPGLIHWTNLPGPWEPLVRSMFTVTLYIPGNFVGQSVFAQFQTNTGTVSPVFCDEFVTEGMPRIPTPDPRTPTSTRRPTRLPIPTGTPSPTRTYGPSPTPMPGPTSTLRGATVYGRVLLADGQTTITGALGAEIDVPLTLDLTGAGAPLCLMRWRLSGVGCREDADGGLAGQPWQVFRREVPLRVPLVRDGVTISAWAQVGNAAGAVSTAFCDDVRVHAPHTATPGGSPTPRLSTPLPPVTPCPRWHAPVYLPAAFGGVPRPSPTPPEF